MERDFITRGFIYATLTGPLMAGGALAITGMMTAAVGAPPLQTFSYSLITLFYSLFFGMFVSFPSCLLLGVPVHLGLKRLGWQRWWLYGLSGTVAGGLLGPIVLGHYTGGVICALLGAASALVFWLTGAWPDRKQRLSRQDAIPTESQE